MTSSFPLAFSLPPVALLSPFTFGPSAAAHGKWSMDKVMKNVNCKLRIATEGSL